MSLVFYKSTNPQIAGIDSESRYETRQHPRTDSCPVAQALLLQFIFSLQLLSQTRQLFTLGCGHAEGICFRDLYGKDAICMANEGIVISCKWKTHYHFLLQTNHHKRMLQTCSTSQIKNGCRIPPQLELIFHIFDISGPSRSCPKSVASPEPGGSEDPDGDHPTNHNC